jgi:TPR repeat protein
MVEARVEYKKVADQGHMFAQYRLALMLHDGAGGPVDMAEARVQFGKSAEQGHRHAE